ncbi:MAG: asparaginase domain-containing protein [Oleibacter sp.]|nr:asparaginase domain-containing protein [Thalassolituus sp.]
MFLQVFTTGGTIDKIYFDQLSEFQIGDSMVEQILGDAGVTFDYSIESLMKKDSLEINDVDRELIRFKVESSNAQHILITHGTDTMAQTAAVLQGVENKTIVLTGAMQPARFRTTDAIYNVGFAIAATQTLAAGVYIAMSGQVFEAGHVRKNRAEGRFEAIKN